MLRALVIMAVSMMAVAVIAAPRMAIVGTGDRAGAFADLVTAELSGEVELLERGAVEALLAERELSAGGLSSGDFLNMLLPVDLFVAIESGMDDEGSYPSRVTVFDAYNGLQLAYVPLPRELESAVETAVAAVRNAVELRESGDFTVISVLTMRGNFTRLPVLLTVEADFMRRMNGIKGVVMAERAHLVRIIAEGRLGVAARALAESHYFVEMMFARGEDEAEFSTILRLVDIADNICFERTFAGESRADTVAMVAAIGEFLQSPVAPVLGTAKEEAKRFFNESEVTGDYTRKERLLEAAMVLDPGHGYEYEWLYMIWGRGEWNVPDIDEHIAGIEARIALVTARGAERDSLNGLHYIAFPTRGSIAWMHQDDDYSWNRTRALNEYFDTVKPRLAAFTKQVHSGRRDSFDVVDTYYSILLYLGPREKVADEEKGEYVRNRQYLEHLNGVVREYLVAIDELVDLGAPYGFSTFSVMRQVFSAWIEEMLENPSQEFNTFLVDMSAEFAKSKCPEIAATAPFVKILTLAGDPKLFCVAYEEYLESIRHLPPEVATRVRDFVNGGVANNYEYRVAMNEVDSIVANRAAAGRRFVKRYIGLRRENTADDAFIAVSREFAADPFAFFAQLDPLRDDRISYPDPTDYLLAKVNPDYDYAFIPLSLKMSDADINAINDKLHPYDTTEFHLHATMACGGNIYAWGRYRVGPAFFCKVDEWGGITPIPLSDIMARGVNYPGAVLTLPSDNMLVTSNRNTGMGGRYVEYDAELNVVSTGEFDMQLNKETTVIRGNTIYFYHEGENHGNAIESYCLDDGKRQIILTGETDLRENDLLRLTGGDFKCSAIWSHGDKLYLFIDNHSAAGIWSIDLSNNNAVSWVWDISAWANNMRWKGVGVRTREPLLCRPVEHNGVLYFIYRWWRGGQYSQRVVIAAFDPATETVRGIAGVRPPEAAGVTVPDNAVWPEETAMSGDLCIVGDEIWVSGSFDLSQSGALRFSLSDPSRVYAVPGPLWEMFPTADSRGVFTVVDGQLYKVKIK